LQVLTMILLGIDFGTTNVKCVAYDERGQMLASASGLTPVVVEQPGHALYPAEEAWAATAGVIRQTVARLERPAEIAGLAATEVICRGEVVRSIEAQGQGQGQGKGQGVTPALAAKILQYHFQHGARVGEA